MNDGILKIGKKVYYLKFDINTLCNLEADGISVLNLQGAVDFKTLRALCYHGLQGVHKKEITSYEDAGEIMADFLNEGTLEEFANTLMSALTKALGQGTVPQGK